MKCKMDIFPIRFKDPENLEKITTNVEAKSSDALSIKAIVIDEEKNEDDQKLKPFVYSQSNSFKT